MSLRREFSNRCMEGKVRKFTTEISADQQFPSLETHLLVHSLQQMSLGAETQDPRERTGVKVLEGANTAQLRESRKKD